MCGCRRVVGDPTDVLNEQLDHLRGDQAQPTPVDQNIDDDLDAAVTAALSTTTGYDTGTWGWTGQHPHPPPGHAPPLAHTSR